MLSGGWSVGWKVKFLRPRKTIQYITDIIESRHFPLCVRFKLASRSYAYFFIITPRREIIFTSDISYKSKKRILLRTFFEKARFFSIVDAGRMSMRAFKILERAYSRKIEFMSPDYLYRTIKSIIKEKSRFSILTINFLFGKSLIITSPKRTIFVASKTPTNIDNITNFLILTKKVREIHTLDISRRGEIPQKVLWLITYPLA